MKANKKTKSKPAAGGTVPLQWTTQKRKISDLVPYDYNPRIVTKEQAEQLKASITKFNLVEIPVINTDNTLIAGHQRVNIMGILGRLNEKVDVRVPNRKLTTAELKEYNIRSNKNTGTWDFDILANHFELSDLVEWGFDKTLEDIFNPKAKSEPQTTTVNFSSTKGGMLVLSYEVSESTRDLLNQAIIMAKNRTGLEVDHALHLIAESFIKANSN